MTLGLTPQEATPDWGNTAADYARWRPDMPTVFYDRLAAFGVGIAGQRVLDIGTGTGFIATSLAARGCSVWATDISPGQVAVAAQRAASLGQTVTTTAAPAEDSGLPSNYFDVVTASQCWGYFDGPRTSAEIARVLKAGGVLAIIYQGWLPAESPILAATEALMSKHTPSWSSGGWDGQIPTTVAGVTGMRALGRFTFDADYAFDHETWRGRIRASRPVGATLDAKNVARFDAEHAELLRDIAPHNFGIPHRLSAHIYTPSGKLA